MPKWSDIEPLCSTRPGWAKPDGRSVSDPKRTLALRTRTAAIQPIGDTVRIGAFITETSRVRRVRTHMGEPPEPPRISPARGPPEWGDPPVDAAPDWDALPNDNPSRPSTNRSSGSRLPSPGRAGDPPSPASAAPPPPSSDAASSPGTFQDGGLLRSAPHLSSKNAWNP